jgi:hypothetical protein
MEELISRVEQAALETEFSGVISVFRDASTVFSKAFGYRDIKNKLPNTTSTIFGIASGTKVFTAREYRTECCRSHLQYKAIEARSQAEQRTQGSRIARPLARVAGLRTVLR